MSRTLGATGQGVLDIGGKEKVGRVWLDGGKVTVSRIWLMVARQLLIMINRWWQGKGQPWLTNGGKVKLTMINWWWQGKHQPWLPNGGRVRQTMLVTRLMVAKLVREHCYSCVEVLGKLLIPCCLCPPCSKGYLVKSAADVLNSPQEISQGRYMVECTVLRSQTLYHYLLRWQDLKNTHTQNSTHLKYVTIFCKLYRCLS